MTGITGLDYAAVVATFPAYKVRKPRKILDKIRQIEAAALMAVAGKSREELGI